MRSGFSAEQQAKPRRPDGDGLEPALGLQLTAGDTADALITVDSRDGGALLPLILRLRERSSQYVTVALSEGTLRIAERDGDGTRLLIEASVAAPVRRLVVDLRGPEVSAFVDGAPMKATLRILDAGRSTLLHPVAGFIVAADGGTPTDPKFSLELEWVAAGTRACDGACAESGRQPAIAGNDRSEAVPVALAICRALIVAQPQFGFRAGTQALTTAPRPCEIVGATSGAAGDVECLCQALKRR